MASELAFRMREDGYLMQINQLRGDNDKLRKLVQDMLLNMGGCALHGNPLRLREFISRAIELGVEVR